MVESPTVRRRVLAARLRALREAAGLSIERVAAELLCSPSKISRLETAARGATLRDVRDLARLYGVDDTVTEELMTLVRDAKQRGWWESFDEVAARSSTFIGLEDAAVALEQYETIRIPGLLQTPDYTRSLMRRIIPGLSADAVEQYVQTRQERQKVLLAPTRPSYWALLDEAALRRQVGGPDIMREQLLALVRAAEDGLVTLQVVPFEAGAHSGMEGSFIVLKFGDPSLSDVVYVEGRSGQLFLNRPFDLQVFREVLDHLRAVAEGPDASIARIAALAGRA
jgi:transcriptional regulator with XRE-family HTH domain